MNIIELKYPISIIENGEKKELKYLTPTRLKVKHFELLPASLMEKSEKEKNIEEEIGSLEEKLFLEKDKSIKEKLEQEIELKRELLENTKGKIRFDTKKLLPMFKELIPFLAGIFNVPIESIKEIDFEDIEKVISSLEEVFPKDEKKN